MYLWLKFLVSFTALAIILTTAPFYAQGLFDQSLPYIVRIQQNASESLVNFWHKWSDFGLVMIASLPILITYGKPEQRTRCFYYFAVVNIDLMVMFFAKSAYHQERPYWVDYSPPIQAFSCSSEFGNPSGHTQTSTTMSVLILLDYITSCQPSNLKKGIGMTSTCLFILSIMYTRIFLGVHSFNQVLFGLLLGIWLAFTSEFCLKQILFKHINSLLFEQAHDAASNNQISYKPALLISIFGSLGLFCLAIIQYTYLTAHVQIQPEWEKNILDKCGQEALDQAFFKVSLYGLGLNLAGFAGYLGILWQSYKYQGMARYKQPNETWRVLLRYLVVSLLTMPFMGLCVFIAATCISVVWIKITLMSIIPMIIAPFLLFGVADEVSLSWFKLYLLRLPQEQQKLEESQLPLLNQTATDINLTNQNYDDLEENDSKERKNL